MATAQETTVEQNQGFPADVKSEQKAVPRKQNPQFVWLSSLRAFGVILVLIYHFFPSILPGGFIGVDVFFVFSGFLITSLLVREYSTKGRIELFPFYFRRLRRLLPAIVFTLLVILPLTFLISPDFRVGIAEQIAAVLGWVTNYYEISNGQSYANQLLPHLFVHTWTLSIEMQYYVIWGALLAWLIPKLSTKSPEGRVSTQRARKILCFVSCVLALVSYGMMQVFLIGADDPSRAYYDTISHFYPLMLGSAVGLVAGFPRSKVIAAAERIPSKVGIALVAVCLGSIAIMARVLPFENLLVFRFGLFLTALLVAVVIIIGRGAQKRLVRYKENRVLTYLADRSYSLYLFHWPLFIIASNLGSPGSPLYFENYLPFTTYVFPILALILTFVLAHISYKYVELPFSSKGKAKKASTCAKGVPLAAAAAPGQHSMTDQHARMNQRGITDQRSTEKQPRTKKPQGTYTGKRYASPNASRAEYAQRKSSEDSLHSAPKRSSFGITSKRLVNAALAIVLAVGSFVSIGSAPAEHAVTATNTAEALYMSETRAQSVNEFFSSLNMDPVVGLTTTDGLPLKPSEGGGYDPALLEAARINMEGRASGEAANESITVLGDSVCNGAASIVVEMTGAYVDAAGFRTMRDAVPLIQQLQDAGALGKYVVIGMSTNILGDSVESTQQVVDMLEPGHHLIFITAYGIDLEYYGLDAYIRSLPEQYPWVSIADWNAVINGHEDKLTSDGIHTYGLESKQMYAQCILDAVDAARGGPVS